jgi:hypothetical protein
MRMFRKHWYIHHRCIFCGRVIWGNGFFNHTKGHENRNPLIKKRRI